MTGQKYHRKRCESKKSVDDQQLKLLDLPKYKYERLTSDEQQFKANFVRAYSRPYAIRTHAGHRARHWRTKHKTLSDPALQAHLRGDYWIAVKAPWYPVFYSLDVDRPTPKILEQIHAQFDRYGITESQWLRMTTPSFDRFGNQRFYLRLEFNGQPPTWKLGYAALLNTIGRISEIYPQLNRKDRLPCGAQQDILTEDGLLLRHLSWQQEMQSLLKIDPIAIEQLPVQHAMFEQPSEDRDRAETWTLRKDARELLTTGLQAFGTRHNSQWILLNELWRQNCFQGEATEKVKKWLRSHHNGFSKDINNGRWSEIYAEIDRQAVSIWKRPRVLPDGAHNLQRAATKTDLKFIAEVFPGDAVRQKQLFNLTSFVRARQQHDWTFISKRIWTEEIAGVRTYQSLIGELEEKGLLKTNRSYQVDRYSRRYQLTLPKTDEKPIERDERNVTDYYEALLTAFTNRRSIGELTKINPRTLFNNFKDFKRV